MSKSILNRIVWGYGILILILILMIFAFVVNITVDRLSSAQNLITGEIHLKVEKLVQHATEQALSPSTENFVKLQLLHQELIQVVIEQQELVGGFFLPAELNLRYGQIRSQFIENSDRMFKPIEQTGGREKQAVTAYISDSFRFLDELHAYNLQVQRFRAQLVTLLIVFFSTLVVAGVAVVGLIISRIIFKALPGGK